MPSREAQRHEACVLVERVRDRAEADEVHCLHVRGLFRVHLEGVAVVDDLGCVIDHGPPAVAKEIGRRKDLRIGIGVKRPAESLRPAAGGYDAPVGQQERRGVIHPRGLATRHQRPSVGVGIPDLGLGHPLLGARGVEDTHLVFLARVAGIARDAVIATATPAVELELPVAAACSAGHEHGAVGQERRVVAPPRNVHRCRRAPLVGDVEIDDLCRGDGRAGAFGRSPAFHHLPRAIHHRRAAVGGAVLAGTERYRHCRHRRTGRRWTECGWRRCQHRPRRRKRRPSGRRS